MAKVITFSRVFPANHPRKGEPTFFVEKIWAHLLMSSEFGPETCEAFLCAHWCKGLFDLKKVEEFIKAGTPKIHTIRGGSRWKKGDKFSPRVWSGKTYFSPQIIFAPELTIIKTQTFYAWTLGGIRYYGTGTGIFHDGIEAKQILDDNELSALAKNDGLSLEEFKAWFAKSDKFEHQIIYF